MDLSQVIIGPVVTEKAERLKAAGPRHTYTMMVHQDATKIDVKNALRRFLDLEVASIRMMRTRPKTRQIGDGRTMEKRHAGKRAFVTLKPKSKPLDLSNFAANAA